MNEKASDIPSLIARGDMAGLKAALAGGADANARDLWGVTVLMRAAALGSGEAVDLLLDHGADPEKTSDAGNTALMAAAARGHMAVVARLLDAGLDPVHQNKWGLSAYDWAKWPVNSAEILGLMQARSA